MRTLLLFCYLGLVMGVSQNIVSYAQPGTVLGFQKISDSEGNFHGYLGEGHSFGMGVSALGDLNGDGLLDISVKAGGAISHSDYEEYEGVVWNLLLDSSGQVLSASQIGDELHNFQSDWLKYGSMSNIGDFNGDGIEDLAVGSPRDDAGSTSGAFFIFFLNQTGVYDQVQKISALDGGFTGILNEDDAFGSDIAPLGDLDGDGIMDLAVGAPGDDDGGHDRGALYILFMNADATVRSHQKISDTEGGFTGILSTSDIMGVSIANIGDLDNDGVVDIAVSSILEDDGCSFNCDNGAVWIMFLNIDGTVKAHQKISKTQGNFSGEFSDGGRFGNGVSLVGDLDGDGVQDIVVSVPYDNDGGLHYGAVFILFMNPNGTVKSQQKISFLEGNFTGVLSVSDDFGRDVAGVGDVNRDGFPDIAVGAMGDNDGGGNSGAVYILYLNGASGSSCAIPLNPEVVVNSTSSVTLKWDEVPSAIGYLMKARPTGTSKWKFQASGTNSKTIDWAFEPAIEYEWRVKSACDDDTSGWSEKSFFVVGLDSCIVPTSDIVSWWRGEGDASDLSGINDGVLMNGVSFAPGKVGQAFEFDGVDDYVEILDHSDLRPDVFTIEAWVKMESFSDLGAVILSKRVSGINRNSYTLWFHKSDLLEVNISDGTLWKWCKSSIDPLPNEFMHVAATWDANKLKLYQNGNMICEQTFPGFTISYDNQPVTIGADLKPWGLDQLFGGVIDEVSIYNRALSAAEIQSLYLAGAQGKCQPEALCPAPEGFTLSGATSVSSTFSWNTVGNVSRYIFYYREIGTSSYTGVITFDTAITAITEPGTSYEAVLKADCGESESVLTDTVFFITPALRLGDWDVQILPNPASSQLQVRIRDFVSLVDLELIDAFGRVVQVHALTGGNIELDLTALSSGIYFVRLTTERQSKVFPVVIE